MTNRKHVLDYTFGVKEYLQSKAPSESERKRNLIGQKQQQFISNLLMSQSQVPTQEPSATQNSTNVGSNSGWGKVR